MKEFSDPAAEVAVARAVYYDPEALPILAQRGFDPEWVTNPVLRAYLRGALQALAEGARPSPENALSRSGLGPEAAAVLLELLHSISPAESYSPDGVVQNLGRLADLHAARRLRRELKAALQALETAPLEVRRVAAEAASRAFDVLRGRETRPSTPSELLRLAAAPKPKPMSTGIPALDRALSGGLHPGLTVAVAAPTGRGKTSLACFLSARVLATGRPVVYFTTEMFDYVIAERIHLALTGSPAPAREFTEGDPAVLAWVERTDPILRVVETARTVREVEALMRFHAAALPGPGLFVLDHFHRLDPGLKRGDQVGIAYGEAARRLVDAARSAGWALLLVGQVSIETEREWTQTGTVSAVHFKYSGDITSHVDFAFFLAWHRKVKRRSVLILHKDRLEGKQMRIELDFDPESCTFAEAPHEP